MASDAGRLTWIDSGVNQDVPGWHLTGAHLEDSYIAHDTKMNKANLTGARLYGVHLGSGVEKEGDVKMSADLSSTAGLNFESLRCAFVEESKDFPMKFLASVSVPPDRSACPAVS